MNETHEHISEGLRSVPATQEDVSNIKESLFDIRTEMQKIVVLIEKTTDHETRIRDLETSKNFLWGAIALIIVIIPVVTSFIIHALEK